jgi:hypothetical protein
MTFDDVMASRDLQGYVWTATPSDDMTHVTVSVSPSENISPPPAPPTVAPTTTCPAKCQPSLLADTMESADNSMWGRVHRGWGKLAGSRAANVARGVGRVGGPVLGAIGAASTVEQLGNVAVGSKVLGDTAEIQRNLQLNLINDPNGHFNVGNRG